MFRLASQMPTLTFTIEFALIFNVEMLSEILNVFNFYLAQLLKIKVWIKLISKHYLRKT